MPPLAGSPRSPFFFLRPVPFLFLTLPCCRGALFSPESTVAVAPPPGEPPGVVLAAEAISVALGRDHVCGLRADSTVWCQGGNRHGELGDGSRFDQADPVPVLGLDHAVELVAGDHHTCARLYDGAVRCWGDNRRGQLGDGSREVRWTPVSPRLPGPVVALAAWGDTTCAASPDGPALCWGDQVEHWRRAGTRGYSADMETTPTPMEGSFQAVAIAVGREVGCTVEHDGQAACWSTPGHLWSREEPSLDLPLAGVSDARRILVAAQPLVLTARGTVLRLPRDDRSPTPIDDLTDIEALAGDADGICALSRGGTVRCGLPPTDNTPVAPPRVPGITRAVAVAARAGRWCVALSDRTVRCWGNPLPAPARRPPVTPHPEPAMIPGLLDATEVTAQGEATCVRTRTGATRCWGNPAEDPVPTAGDGATAGSVPPEAREALQVATAWDPRGQGHGHGCMVLRDHTAACWGDNREGALGTGTTEDSPSPVAVTALTGVARVVVRHGAVGAFSCALRLDGTVWCWGSPRTGSLGTATTAVQPIPVQVPGITRATEITAGDGHVCVLLQGGSVACWGDNRQGQLGVPSPEDSLRLPDTP